MTLALVSGATGFVGTHLISLLEAQGVQVRKIVRSPASQNDPDARMINSIDATTDWADSFEGVDVVFHLAAHVHQMGKMDEKDHQRFFEVNHLGTVHMAKKAHDAGVKHFIFLSSLKVYGETTSGQAPLKETDPCAPLDPYGQSKRRAENDLQAFSDETKMAISVIRIPLVYGPGVKANFLSLLKMIDRLPYLPFGGLKNHRDMIYVENLVHGLHHVASNRHEGYEVFNLCDQHGLTMAEFFDHLYQAFEKPNKNLHIPHGLLKLCGLLPGIGSKLNKIIADSEMNADKFQKRTHWQAPYSLEDGLRKTVAWYKSL